ncbi:HNH endonuclease signature motif containing protein [Mesorhizobium sp.]|uniref:HNH endonuclease n=1 Tax=Mesorhizobium sp. TaxID=1871066 RepID=UPI001227D99D|nr:HNH endonuclease signature motif containing protein [Mesorhizobium sp.]TJV18007.1 MAG: HNH endonuclease [Mesorhizobium sp.]
MGRYDSLGRLLADVEENEITISLTDIATLVGPLPPEAERNQFWANVRGHHHARRRQWLENGFHAFFDRAGSRVRFVRAANGDGDLDADRSDKPWTDNELRICAEAYRRLWDAEQRGDRMNKSALRREVLEADLIGRVKGSYEFRMQNISALLDELGLPFVRGYLPRKNVGGVKGRLVAIINDIWNRNGMLETPTADPEELATRVVAALDKLSTAIGRPPSGTADVPRVAALSNRFARDPNVIAWVLQRADGHCEACSEKAPFNRSDGTPFLEVHHLRPLSEGGPDIVANTIAACPNCHRRLHHGPDRQQIRRSILKRIPGLVDHPKREIGFLS